MNRKFAVIFTVPVELKVEDGAKPDIEKVIQALKNAALNKLKTGTYTPSIEEIHEIISENENRGNSGPGHQHQRGTAHIRIEPTEREKADNAKDLQGNVSWKEEREESGPTGETGDESQDSKEDERGVHVDHTV